jgi:hypothetical protein
MVACSHKIDGCKNKISSTILFKLKNHLLKPKPKPKIKLNFFKFEFLNIHISHLTLFGMINTTFKCEK